LKCQYCNKEAKSNNSKRQHEVRCKSNPDRISLGYLRDHPQHKGIEDTPCLHCGKIYSNQIGLSNHIRRCSSNPNRKLELRTAESKAKSLSTKIKNGTLTHTEEAKKKISVSMKRAVLANPESYSSSNRGRTRQIVVDGIKLQGQWEVDFYLWAKAAGLEPERPKEGFPYQWNGLRTYFPDFYLPGLDLYVEVKGYETDRDRSKWSQFPKKLRIIKAAEIKQIRKNCFAGF
jgi:hypothetical protein